MEDNIKRQIIDTAINFFNESGTKFTMDEIAKKLHISKKTIYKYFDDKTMLLLACVDRYFDSIKEAEQRVLEDDSLDDVEKLKRIIIALPDEFGAVNWSKVSETVNNNDEIYKRYRKRVDSDWESTFELLKKNIEAGRIKPISFRIFKLMIESCIEGFIREQSNSDEEYSDELMQMIEIFMNGIIIS